MKIPKNVEAVWGLIKPKFQSARISEIIACSFYSPPDMGSNKALIDHLTDKLHSLLTKHPNAGVILSGDRNSMKVDDLLAIDPTLSQTVKLPTRGDNILDVIITDLSKYYAKPIIIPPITPDQPNKAVPSDHYGIFVQPSLTCNQPQNRNKTFKIIRPLPESLIPKFKIYLSEHDISFSDEETAPEMINKFQAVLDQALSEVFPEKKDCMLTL